MHLHAKCVRLDPSEVLFPCHCTLSCIQLSHLLQHCNYTTWNKNIHPAVYTVNQVPAGVNDRSSLSVAVSQ